MLVIKIIRSYMLDAIGSASVILLIALSTEFACSKITHLKSHC